MCTCMQQCARVLRKVDKQHTCTLNLSGLYRCVGTEISFHFSCSADCLRTRLRETGCMRGCVSMCGLHITESMTYLARHEALWVQWRDGRIGKYGIVTGGIERRLSQVPAPTVPAARRLVLLVSHSTRGPCQVCRRQVSPASILFL